MELEVYQDRPVRKRKEDAHKVEKRTHTWDEGQKGQKETNARTGGIIAAGNGDGAQGAKGEARFETCFDVRGSLPLYVDARSRERTSLDAWLCLVTGVPQSLAPCPGAPSCNVPRGSHRDDARHGGAQVQQCGLLRVVEAERWRAARGSETRPLTTRV
jgi:hypothetical protein